MSFNKSIKGLEVDNLQIARESLYSSAVAFLAALVLFNEKNQHVSDQELEEINPAHIVKRKSIVDAIADLGSAASVKTKLEAIVETSKAE